MILVIRLISMMPPDKPVSGGMKKLCALAAGLLVLLLAGCAARPLMPTPNLYVDGTVDPFPDLPAELQSNRVELLYVTDRLPVEDNKKGGLNYGYGRSNSLAWGVATVALGGDISWSELVEASRTDERSKTLRIEMPSVEERGRGPGTPVPFRIEKGFPQSDPKVLAELRKQTDLLHEELSRRLALTERKHVYIFVHGYKNSFEDAALGAAELHHFGGRMGVPLVYSWPAGHPGLLRGYNYDRESSEYTVHHLKELIRFVAALPEVEKIQLIGHSRGSDVVLAAVRELFIEAWAMGISPRELYRIENLVLLAADLDIQVVEQRLVGERINAGVSQLLIYTSPGDQAIGIAESLFSSPRGRLGTLQISELTEQEKQQLEDYEWTKTVTFVTFSGTSEQYGHSYFRTDPRVSSDLILHLKGVPPGSSERPLVSKGFGFWGIPKSYPRN